MNRHIYGVSLILGIFFFLGEATAQFNISSQIMYGKVVRHKPTLLYEILTPAKGTDFILSKSSHDSSGWKAYWGNPDIELQFGVIDFGNPAVLGKAFSFNPGLKFKIKDWNSVGLYLHSGTGISFLTKKFDKIDNITNNAIGTNLNNNSRIKLSFDYRLCDSWYLQLGGNLSHYSNGLIANPNSGINVFYINAGFQYNFGNHREKNAQEKVNVTDIKEPLKRFGYLFQFGYAITEFLASDTGISGGPKYPIFIYSIGGYWRFADYQRLIFGVDYEFNHAVYEFHDAIFTEDKLAKNLSRRTVFFIGDELLFGDFSSRYVLGIYTPFFNEYKEERIYFKLQTSYYPSFLDYGDIKPYIGIVMKSHYAVAEYLGLVIGMTY